MADAIAALDAMTPSSVAEWDFSLPPKDPIGVRFAPTMNTPVVALAVSAIDTVVLTGKKLGGVQRGRKKERTRVQSHL